MSQNRSEHRIGFHSIESILNINPQKIIKLFLPANRNDTRIKALMDLADSKDVSYEASKKISQEPEAHIKIETLRPFQELKTFLTSLRQEIPLILILDNIIDPRNLGACIRSAAATNVDAVIINKHHCAPTNAIAHIKNATFYT